MSICAILCKSPDKHFSKILGLDVNKVNVTNSIRLAPFCAVVTLFFISTARTALKSWKTLTQRCTYKTSNLKLPRDTALVFATNYCSHGTNYSDIKKFIILGIPLSSTINKKKGQGSIL